jgi:hypothetical protein
VAAVRRRVDGAVVDGRVLTEEADGRGYPGGLQKASIERRSEGCSGC